MSIDKLLQELLICFNLSYNTLGSLPTCSVCNTAHEMMRSKKWNSNQKDVILKFLRLHLKQQLTERLHLEKVKKFCRTNKGYFK
jgi:hypothetical protein